MVCPHLVTWGWLTYEESGFGDLKGVTASLWFLSLSLTCKKESKNSLEDSSN